MHADRVLVTGASGFIAKYCIAELLAQGFAVRGTVRSLARRPEIEAAVRRLGVPAPEIELVEADLEHDAGWSEAATGCRYVLHLASPFPATEPRNPDELIKPARNGALRILNAAAGAGVERIVQTSSIVAIMYCGKPDHVVRTEADWTDLSRPDISSYARSKTLAERVMWETAAELAATSRIELCTINPGLVLGPAVDRDLSTSHVLLRLLGRGAYPALPKVAFPIVDVRDVARHHVVAMTHRNAAGNRWLCCNGTLSLVEIARLIAETLPDLKAKVPTRVLPTALVRLAAVFDRDLRALRGDLGNSNRCDNNKAVTELGMTFRPAGDAVRSAVQSLRELGII